MLILAGVLLGLAMGLILGLMIGFVCGVLGEQQRAQTAIEAVEVMDAELVVRTLGAS